MRDGEEETGLSDRVSLHRRRQVHTRSALSASLVAPTAQLAVGRRTASRMEALRHSRWALALTMSATLGRLDETESQPRWSLTHVGPGRFAVIASG